MNLYLIVKGNMKRVKTIGEGTVTLFGGSVVKVGKYTTEVRIVEFSNQKTAERLVIVPEVKKSNVKTAGEKISKKAVVETDEDRIIAQKIREQKKRMAEINKERKAENQAEKEAIWASVKANNERQDDLLRSGHQSQHDRWADCTPKRMRTI